MLDLKAVRQRAATRASVDTRANPANWLIQAPPISQLATLATTARRMARPFKLTLVQGGAAHADPWDEPTMARFEARTGHLGQMGFGEQDAEDLAERLHLRDVHADYRHLCLECRHYRPGRCGNHKAAALSSPVVARDLATTFQDCAGFSSVKTSEG